MSKIVFSLIVIAASYIFYFDGLKPYFSALSETNRLVVKANIPIENMFRKKYREEVMKLLTAECTYGLYHKSDKDFRCKSGASFDIFK